MSKGTLSGFLRAQGISLLVATIAVAVLVWSDRFLRIRHSAEWMTRYYRWVIGVIGAAGLVFFALVFHRAGLKANREGALGDFALPLVSMAVVVGAIVGIDMFFRKRKSARWMNGFRICMALVIVALLTGLGAYLLSQSP